MTDETEATETEEQREEPDSPIGPALRLGLEELDPFLANEPEDRLAERVLPFATRWILEDVDIDLERFTEEAKTFVLASGIWDRALRRFPRDVTYWLSQRMLVDEHTHEPDPAMSARILASAREQIAQRAELLDAEGYPNVARAFRVLLTETAGGEPPADPIFQALALRIVEPFVQDAANPIPPDPTPSEPPEPEPE